MPGTTGNHEWRVSKLVEDASVPGRVKRLADVEECNRLVSVFLKGRCDNVLQAVQVSVGGVLSTESSLLLREVLGDQWAEAIENHSFEEANQNRSQRNGAEVSW